MNIHDINFAAESLANRCDPTKPPEAAFAETLRRSIVFADAWREAERQRRAEYETHHAPGHPQPWIALHMPTGRKACEPYTTPNADLITLIIDACRVLDEKELIGYGDTEEEALEAARKAAKQP